MAHSFRYLSQIHEYLSSEPTYTYKAALVACVCSPGSGRVETGEFPELASQTVRPTMELGTR